MSISTTITGDNLCWVEAIVTSVSIVIENKGGIDGKLKLNSIANQNNKITLEKNC